MGIEPLHQRWTDRLNHKMDVPRLTLRMRPQARIDLPRWLADLGRSLGDGSRHPREGWSELGDFGLVEVRKVDHVALGLDDDGPHPKWPDAVLDNPTTDRRYTTARDSFWALYKVACQATHLSQCR